VIWELNRMRLALAAALAITLVIPVAHAQTKAATPAKADPNLIIRESQNSVKDTLDKLAKAVESKGAKVVARVDHAAGAKAVGSDMKPMEVLIFGNPKLGTPVLLGNPRAGLDLPLKVLAYEDASGKVFLAYPKPEALRGRYGLKGKDQDANFKAIGDALDGLTGAAIAK
jgi:uncharacterized protein (DUF302 family)